MTERVWRVRSLRGSD